MELSILKSLQSGLSEIPLGLRHLHIELILISSLVIILFLELFAGKIKNWLIPAILFGGIATGLLSIIFFGIQSENSTLFFGMIHMDYPAHLIRFIIGASALICIVFAYRSTHYFSGASGMGEFYLLMTALLIGLYTMSMASHLLFLYLSIELVSVSSYLLTTYVRKDKAAAEASVKYILFGAFSSAIMLYGISLLYGLTGSLDPSSPGFIAQLAAYPPGVQLIALSFVLAGLLFKVGAVPFQFWVPDIYQGASFPVVAFFSVAPKAAGFLLLIRFLFRLEDLEITIYLQWILAMVAVASMTLGNLSALWQQDFKRLLAYSSIAQAGFMMMGVSCFSMLGRTALLYYICIYMLINLGTFLLAGLLIPVDKPASIQQFAGMGKRLPFMCICLSVCLIALIGLPPTAGFIGKWYLFLAVWEQIIDSGEILWWALIVIALINTVISLFYYLKIPILMFFRPEIKDSDFAGDRVLTFVSFALSIPVVVLGIWGFDTLLNNIQVGLWN